MGDSLTVERWVFLFASGVKTDDRSTQDYSRVKRDISEITKESTWRIKRKTRERDWIISLSGW